MAAGLQPQEGQLAVLFSSPSSLCYAAVLQPNIGGKNPIVHLVSLPPEKSDQDIDHIATTATRIMARSPP